MQQLAPAPRHIYEQTLDSIVWWWSTWYYPNLPAPIHGTARLTQRHIHRGTHDTHYTCSDSVIAHLSIKETVARLAFNSPGNAGNLVIDHLVLESQLPNTVPKPSPSVVTMRELGKSGTRERPDTVSEPFDGRGESTMASKLPDSLRCHTRNKSQEPPVLPFLSACCESSEGETVPKTPILTNHTAILGAS